MAFAVDYGDFVNYERRKTTPSLLRSMTASAMLISFNKRFSIVRHEKRSELSL